MKLKEQSSRITVNNKEITFFIKTFFSFQYTRFEASVQRGESQNIGIASVLYFKGINPIPIIAKYK